MNILMVGVGGQGTVLASEILAQAALAEGFDVKKSDALGMSQRGGSVVSHVRLGPRVFSPLVTRGEADILLGFEKLEAARWADHLRPGGLAIINDQAIPPFSVSSGSEKYPPDELVLEILHRKTGRVFVVAGLALAQAAGNPRTLNAAMLGFLSVILESPGPNDDQCHVPSPNLDSRGFPAPAVPRTVISKDAWLHCLAQALPPKLLEMNILAFEKGRQAAEAAVSSQQSDISRQP